MTANEKGEGEGDEHRRLITVFYGVDDKEFKLKPGVYTTEELIGIFQVPAGYLLNALEDGVIVTLQPGQKVHLKEGMHFYSQPPGGGSS